MKRSTLSCLTAALISAAVFATTAVQAQSAASELSAISALPVVLSAGVVGAAAGAAAIGASAILSAGATLVVVSVEIVAGATVWVLERASDGVRISLKIAGKLVEGSVLSVGTAVVVAVVGTGYILSAAGKAIAFIPNEIGRALLYNERVSR
jgi:hypothetical protein